MDGLLFFDGSVASNGSLTPTSVNSGTTFTSATPQDSANIIDVSNIAANANAQGRDIGIGDDPSLQIECLITATFTGTGATMAVEIQTAPDGGSGTPGSWTVLETTPAIGVANLTAGTELFRVPMPLGVQKFLKLTYVVGTANMTAGAIVSSVVIDRQALGPLMGYKSGFSNQYS
jgi:translation initiation factor 6 (eIF-6)